MSINLNRSLSITVDFCDVAFCNCTASSLMPVPVCDLYGVVAPTADSNPIPSDFIFLHLKKCLTWREVKMPLIDRIG